ncbi:TonB-dependent receptor plug domain-containing protein [Pseudothauera nasutitermitis]|uniref:TonB-dependent receptor plug domain-containing protein n=1 Tax=Pseudothauera nasutitermitis TaxID=2565930 RepID=UPI001454DA93|nr:TonB-dependent receptor [Pseudothauera nasutitermitis]
MLSGFLFSSLTVSGGQLQAAEEVFFTDLPIVASVSRLPQRLADTPSSVTVIDREMIRASGARALNDVLRLVPGFQTFTASDKPTRVNYHGITDDSDFSPRVQVLVDGRSLHSPLFRGGMNWELPPVALEDIERIEVVRGSNTTSYGTNAFLGVVNIITTDPALAHGTSISASNGTQGVRDYTLRTAGALGMAGHFRLTMQEQADEGLDHRAVPLEDQNWRDRNRTRLLDLRANFQLDTRNHLDLQFGRVENRRLTGRVDVSTGAPRPSDPLRPLDQSSTWMQGRWLYTISPEADFSLRYTYNEDRLENAVMLPQYGKYDPGGGRGVRHEIEALHTLLPSEHTRLVWGASWRYDTLKSPSMLDDVGEVSRRVGRVFVNGEWRPWAWFTGNLGVSYEYDAFAGRHTAPRASAAFHLTPENTLRLGYSRAWRNLDTLDYRARQRISPTEFEWLGNPDLPAEGLESWELAYLGDWRALRMSLDVRHFRERVSDRPIQRIRAVAGEPYTVQPVHDLLVKGYEFQWKWQPVKDTRLAVSHARVRIDGELTSVGRRLADPATGSNFSRPANLILYMDLSEQSAPSRSSSLLLMQRLPWGVEFSLARYWVRDIKWTRNTNTGKYNRTDARIGYPFVIGRQRGELAYTVQSLDGAHAEERMERIVERRHWMTLRLDF